jgi:hypothetical protein
LLNGLGAGHLCVPSLKVVYLIVDAETIIAEKLVSTTIVPTTFVCHDVEA